MHKHSILSFFLTNSTGAPQEDLDGHMIPVLVFSSKNSYRVFSSSANRKYIEPKRGILSPSICIAKS